METFSNGRSTSPQESALSHIEERRWFQFFLASSDKPEGIYTFYLMDDRNGVLGKELVLSNGKKVVYYFWQFNDTEALLMMCVDKDGDIETMLDDMTEYDMEVYSRPWPNLITAIDNGINNRLHQPSLIAFDIHSKRSYFTSLLLSNIILSEADESEYIMRKVTELMKFTTEMVTQLAENELSAWEKAKIFGGSFLGTYAKIADVIKVITAFS